MIANQDFKKVNKYDIDDRVYYMTAYGAVTGFISTIHCTSKKILIDHTIGSIINYRCTYELSNNILIYQEFQLFKSKEELINSL